MATLQNDALTVRLDPTTGALIGVTNRVRGLELLDEPVAASAHPWRLETEPGSAEETWLTPTDLDARFTHETAEGRADLTWHCRRGITVRATVELPPGDADAVFTVAVDNEGEETVSLVEYPVVSGIGRLVGAPATHRLLHPYATGFLVTDPLDLFGPGEGVPPAPYPEGFNGCPAQLMAYYADGVGGFSFAVHDATGWVKWLDVRKDAAGERLTSRFLHSATDATSGNGIELPYGVRLGALAEGTWYEAADAYRDWARTQPFCERGPLHARDDRARWLLEDVGFVVFGVTTKYDRGTWLRFFHDIADVPVLHVTGPNWQAGGYDYRGNAGGGRESVHPATILPGYRATLAEQGDHFATFSFATLFSDTESPEYAEATAAYQRIPGRDGAGDNTLSRDRYRFPFTCPVPDLQRRNAVHRDTAAVAEYGASGVYWDIGPNNVVMRCLSGEHGHGRGGGPDLAQAFRFVLAETRTACTEAAGRYVPLGCEMVNEVLLPELDFYQARAEAGPCSQFEAHPFWPWIRTGDCVKVPLFTYLYHEYGPVRMDGWGQLAAEQGDLFFWIAARVFAWGGLYELNYEFTSLEAVDGAVDDMRESYAPHCVQRQNPVRAECVAFVREIALARTGFANRYVAYGEMLRPLPFDAPDVDLSWFHYDAPPDRPEYEAGGVATVSSVVHAAWRYRRESVGFLFVNLLTEPQDVVVTLDPDHYDLNARELHLLEVTLDGIVDRGPVDGGVECNVTLPSRRVVLLELSAATPQAAGRRYRG